MLAAAAAGAAAAAAAAAGGQPAAAAVDAAAVTLPVRCLVQAFSGFSSCKCMRWWWRWRKGPASLHAISRICKSCARAVVNHHNRLSISAGSMWLQARC